MRLGESDIALIPEIYPGIEEGGAAGRLGCLPTLSGGRCDRARDGFGDAEDHTAASRSPFDWFNYQIGMRELPRLRGRGRSRHGF